MSHTMAASSLAAAEAEAVFTLAVAAARVKAEEAEAMAAVEAAALANLAKAASDVRDVPRPPQMDPPPKKSAFVNKAWRRNQGRSRSGNVPGPILPWLKGARRK
mmetsp:Transcript_32890/g.90739  ORF Transcript_32890/g.90739 Transcript_32890/m.90739 type:complete len:104 (+) Transcript_32890:120-431(+)